jgi:DNA (cytosine-5)-methyltransferase 1
VPTLGADGAPADHLYVPACDPRGRRSVHPLDGPAPTVRCTVRPFRAAYAFTARDSCADRARIAPATCAHNAALQGFPRGYDWSGASRTAVARCVGNAVPPPLARLVGEAVAAADRGA